ncbi:hypothetical protein ENBRE01_1789 [Enteropsectra breve]|nr:hypothetical protein ENBRE01_1789 [Enteropsectra breve]
MPSTDIKLYFNNRTKITRMRIDEGTTALELKQLLRNSSPQTLVITYNGKLIGDSEKIDELGEEKELELECCSIENEDEEFNYSEEQTSPENAILSEENESIKARDDEDIEPFLENDNIELLFKEDTKDLKNEIIFSDIPDQIEVSEETEFTDKNVMKRHAVFKQKEMKTVMIDGKQTLVPSSDVIEHEGKHYYITKKHQEFSTERLREMMRGRFLGTHFSIGDISQLLIFLFIFHTENYFMAALISFIKILALISGLCVKHSVYKRIKNNWGKQVFMFIASLWLIDHSLYNSTN